MEGKELRALPEPEDIQVVVLMGGLGTRLGMKTKDYPKSLVDVNGRPFFDYQLDLMRSYGFRKFLFLTGFKGELIERHYGDGSSFDVSIFYSRDGEKLRGTGGAIRNAYPLLEEDFLLIYGDSFMDIDYRETIYRYFRGRKRGCSALMTVMENSRKLDKSNVIFEEGEILLYDKQNTDSRMHYVDYGIGMFSKSIFGEIEDDMNFDIAMLEKKLSLEGKLAAHEVTNRFYEIGSEASLNAFMKYAAERFDEKRKAIFLDRDGVLNEIVFNEDTEQLDSPLSVNELRMKDGVAEALQMLQKAGYYLFIVTNQPAAAKGKVSLEKLYDINTELCKRLREDGIEINAVEMCPHYPRIMGCTKETFLIKQCRCRKPQDGLIDAICKRFKIDRRKSWMIGDSCTDIMAGKKAELKTAFLGNYKCDVCKLLGYDKPDWIGEDLVRLAEKLSGGEMNEY